VLQAVTASDVSNAAFLICRRAGSRSRRRGRSAAGDLRRAGLGALRRHRARGEGVGRAAGRRRPFGSSPRVQGRGLAEAREGLPLWSTISRPPRIRTRPASASACAHRRAFIGREALARIKATASSEGSARSPADTLPRTPTCTGARRVRGRPRGGRLRSGGWGYTVAKHIGLVYLPPRSRRPARRRGGGVRRALRCRGGADALYDPAAPGSAYSPPIIRRRCRIRS